jgi:hypothetical protein
VSNHIPEARSCLRSTTKAIVALYGFILAVAFALVLLHPPWVGLMYARPAACVVVIMAEWTVRSRSIRGGAGPCAQNVTLAGLADASFPVAPGLASRWLAPGIASH